MQYSQHSEAPDAFHFWTGISVIAGALRRQVWIDQKYFQWTPNFYIILVSPPGIVSKSTTGAIGMNLLRQLEAIHFGPDVVTWQALVQSMAQSTESFPMPDGTYYTMSAVTVFSSELGNFFNPKDREMVDALTHLWDGQISTFNKMTKTQGSDKIVNPWVNLHACTTPKWIAANFPEQMVGGGFTSRSILVYGEKKRRLITYPADEIKDGLFKHQEDDLVHDLEVISLLRGEFTLTDDAKVWGRAWYKDHWTRTRAELSSEVYANYLSRKQTHVHKLAMVISAARKDELVIRTQELIEADRLVTGLEEEMTRVFETVGQSVGAKQGDLIISTMKSMGACSQEQLYRKLRVQMDWNEYCAAMKAAQAAGYVTVEGSRVYYREP